MLQRLKPACGTPVATKGFGSMRQRPLNLRLLLGGERFVSQQLGGSDQ
jgi:hypothetical protein